MGTVIGDIVPLAPGIATSAVVMTVLLPAAMSVRLPAVMSVLLSVAGPVHRRANRQLVTFNLTPVGRLTREEKP